MTQKAYEDAESLFTEKLKFLYEENLSLKSQVKELNEKIDTQNRSSKYNEQLLKSFEESLSHAKQKIHSLQEHCDSYNDTGKYPTHLDID